MSGEKKSSTGAEPPKEPTVSAVDAEGGSASSDEARKKKSTGSEEVATREAVHAQSTIPDPPLSPPPPAQQADPVESAAKGNSAAPGTNGDAGRASAGVDAGIKREEALQGPAQPDYQVASVDDEEEDSGGSFFRDTVSSIRLKRAESTNAPRSPTPRTDAELVEAFFNLGYEYNAARNASSWNRKASGASNAYRHKAKTVEEALKDDPKTEERIQMQRDTRPRVYPSRTFKFLGIDRPLWTEDEEEEALILAEAAARKSSAVADPVDVSSSTDTEPESEPKSMPAPLSSTSEDPGMEDLRKEIQDVTLDAAKEKEANDFMRDPEILAKDRDEVAAEFFSKLTL